MPDNITFELKGKKTEGIRDLEGLQILATFDNGSAQPNISTSQIRFVGDAAEILIEHFDNGGAFEGVPFNMSLSAPLYQAFIGMVNLAENVVIDRDKKEVTANIKQLDGLNNFETVSQGITASLLVRKEVFKREDYVNIPYIKETEYDGFGIAIALIGIFVTTEKAADTVKELNSIIAEFSADSANPITTANAAAKAVLKALIYATYLLALSAALASMINGILKYLLVLTRYHKGILLKNYIEKACDFAGYKFQSSISELADLYYLPKKTERGLLDVFGFELGNTNQTGVPTTTEQAYTLSGAVKILLDAFDSKLQIQGNTVNLEPRNNFAFWRDTKKSAYTIPDVLVNSEKYNTEEINGVRSIEFQTDVNDIFTIGTLKTDNEKEQSTYKGTIYEVKTFPANFPTVNGRPDGRFITLKGIDETIIPCSLATRKEKLNELESILSLLIVAANLIPKGVNEILKLINKIPKVNIPLFPTITNPIKGRIGMILMSSDFVNNPKLIRLQGDLRLPDKYRDGYWSAKYLMEKYHTEKSFQNNQWRLYEKTKLNFNFEDFLLLILNGYCKYDGKEAKVEAVNWYFRQNYAEMDFRVRANYLRNTNLIETGFEPN